MELVKDLYYENMNGLNDVQTGSDYDDYKKYYFNDDINIVVLDYLQNYHTKHEEEIRELLYNCHIDYKNKQIIKNVSFKGDYRDYLSGVEKLIENIVDYYILSQE